MSFVHVGQDWYGYGWEVQLLETGFLAIFLCPLLDGRPFPRRPPPLVIIWLFRALIFRIMFGAGMIKIRGDESWRDLTALYYHFETQPIPNGLSRWFHFLPARRFARRDALQSSRGTGRALVRLLAAARAHIAGMRHRRLSNHDRARRQPLVSELAHDRSRARLLRRPRLGESSAAPPNETGGGRAGRGGHFAAYARDRVGDRSARRAAQHSTGVEHFLAASDHEHLLRSARSGEHLRRLWQRSGKNVTTSFSKARTTASSLTTVRIGNRIPTKGFRSRSTSVRPQIAPYQLRLDWQMWFAAMGSPDQYPWTLT